MKRLALLLTVLVGCEPAPVVPTSDRRQSTRASRIEGTLVVASRARGNAVVLLFDAARPPPPKGTGRPLSFAVVPKETLFGQAAPESAGPFTAPFAFSLVAPGRYLVRGFVDRSPGDFIPWYGVTGEPNAGDVGGAALDPRTLAERVVEIPEDSLEPALGVTVSVQDSATVPTDRPAFRVEGARNFDPAAGPLTLTLLPQPIDAAPVHQPRPAFFARWVDENGDGTPDDLDKDGLPDLWPRVVVRKLADFPSSLQEEPIVLAAGFSRAPLEAALTSSQGQPAPLASLELVIRPQALDLSNPAAVVPLERVPPGRYGIGLLQFTGQSWRQPNELSPSLDPRPPGLPALESQAFVLEVP